MSDDILPPWEFSAHPGHFFLDDCIGWTTSTNPEQKVSLEFVSVSDSNGKKTYASCILDKNGVRIEPSGLQVPTGGFSANDKLYAIYTIKNNDVEYPYFKGKYDYNNIFLALKKDGINNVARVREYDEDWNTEKSNDFFIANWEIMWKSVLVSTSGSDPEHSITG